jgi:hypothetical protein
VTAALTLSGLGSPQISLTDQARNTRDSLLIEAGECQAVGDQLDADAAAELLKRLKGWSRQVEAGRTTVKAPVLELSRRIDSLAAELVAQVEAQANRISRMLGEWQAAERRKAEEAFWQQQRREVQLRQQAAAQMAAAEIESGNTAEAEHRKAEIADKYQLQVAEGRQALAATTAPRITGTGVREDWKYEVTDIQALHQAHPELVVLQPNNAAIRAIVKHNQHIPGLRIWKEATTIIRS